MIDGRDILYDTKFGTVRVWADGNGIYIDLYNDKKGDVCLLSLMSERNGLMASVYGNHKSGLPTYEFLFDNTEHAFDLIPDYIIDEGDCLSA